MEPKPSAAGFSKGKVLRPLLCWFFFSAVLLVWRYHQQQERKATLQFSVTIENRKERPFYRAELNGTHFNPGEHSGLGRKTLNISAADAESFSTNLFVWYGGKDLGHIILKRSRGTLDLKVVPGAKRVSVAGLEASKDFTNVNHESLSLPTGHYKVHAQFERFNIERAVEITAHKTNIVVIDPGLTAVALSSFPTNAEFELNSIRPEGVTIRSNTPVLLSEMPAGEYQLHIWRGDYRKTVPLRVDAGSGTNEFKVEFDYARLSVTSEPAGAEIRDGERILGSTPAELTLPTGLYRLSIVKQEFYSTNVTLTLQANEQPHIALNLLSRAYVESMQQARDKVSGFPPSWDEALDQVNKALQAKPGDEPALALQRLITFRSHLHKARELQRNRALTSALAEIESALKLEASDTDALALKRELEREQQSVLQTKAEARRELPQKVFEQTVTRISHHDLFPSQKMSFAGSLADARGKITEALGRNPAWNIRRNDTPDAEVAIVQAEIKGFGSRQSAVVIAGQTADNEVTIYFKLWTYTLGNNIQVGLTGISDDSYKPLHLSYATTLTAPTIERRRARELEEFKKRLESEFR
jgi:tetratricopeptide (TPR) repeat protein